MLYYFVGPFRPLISLAGGLLYSVGAYARRSVDTPQPLSVGVPIGCAVCKRRLSSHRYLRSNRFMNRFCTGVNCVVVFEKMTSIHIIYQKTKL